MKTVAYASAMCAVASTVALAALVALLASSPGAAAELISTPAAQPAEDVGVMSITLSHGDFSLTTRVPMHSGPQGQHLPPKPAHVPPHPSGLLG